VMQSTILNRLAILCAQHSFDLATAARLLEEARRVAEASGDPVILAETAWNLAQMAIHAWTAEQALRHAERALELAHRTGRKELTARSLYTLGLSYGLYGRWEEVVPAASRLIQLQPNSPLTLHNLGLAYLHTGQTSQAIAPLEQAVKLRPDDPEALCTLGWALTAANQYHRAETTLQHALRLKPEFPEALNNLGRLYAILGRRDEAYDYYAQALRTRPNFPPALGGLATVARDLGHLDEAIAFVAKKEFPAVTGIPGCIGLSMLADRETGRLLLGFVRALTIDAARSAVQERKTTALALTEAHYERIKQEDGQIGAFLTLSKERALEQADRMDRLAAEGKTLPPLGGVPVGIKDVMSTRGVRTTAGSKILEKYSVLT